MQVIPNPAAWSRDLSFAGGHHRTHVVSALIWSHCTKVTFAYARHERTANGMDWWRADVGTAAGQD